MRRSTPDDHPRPFRVAARVGAAIGVLALPLPPTTAVGGAPAVHEVAFEFATRQPIVPVSVNGGPAVPFVVDTGASIHVIDSGIARRAGIADGPSTPLAGGGQTVVGASFVNGVKLETGGLAWSGQRAAVSSLGYPDGKHFAGLLGAPVLKQYTVRFAFQARRLRLVEPSTYQPPSGAVVLPFELQEDLPIVRATIDTGAGSIEARLMVDTGAATFVDLNRPFVDAHGLLAAIPDASSSDRPAALDGTAPFLYGTGRRVTLGGLAFDKPRLGLSRAQSGSSARRERDGIIGNDLVGRFDMTVDYSRRVILLERPSQR
jgi:hypothetical protein